MRHKTFHVFNRTRVPKAKVGGMVPVYQNISVNDLHDLLIDRINTTPGLTNVRRMALRAMITHFRNTDPNPISAKRRMIEFLQARNIDVGPSAF